MNRFSSNDSESSSNLFWYIPNILPIFVTPRHFNVFRNVKSLLICNVKWIRQATIRASGRLFLKQQRPFEFYKTRKICYDYLRYIIIVSKETLLREVSNLKMLIPSRVLFKFQ